MASYFTPQEFSPNENEQIALAIIPKITGTISALFSLVIVIVVLRSPRRRKQTFHRMMAALSLIDTVSSLSFAMSTWLIPRGEDSIWAIGTQFTCGAQAFFIHMAVASMLYNVSLSYYYLLVIRYGWKDHAIKRLEPLLHAVPLTWGVVTGFISLFRGAFGNAKLWCWIKGDYQFERWGFYYGPLLVCFVVIFINCYLTWRKVHDVESTISKYEYRGNKSGDLSSSNQDSNEDVDATANGSQRRKVRFIRGSGDSAKRRRKEFKRSSKLAHQCFLYAGGFYVTWTFMMLSRLVQLINPTKTILIFMYIATFCAPMQGLPNILVYLLPEIKKAHKTKHITWIRSFISAIFVDKTGANSNSLVSSTSNIESAVGEGEEDPNNNFTFEGNDGTMTKTDDQMATAEAGMVETGENYGNHDSSSDDDSMEDEDETIQEPQETTMRLSTSERRSSNFFTAWMDRRVGHGWTKNSSSNESSNEMTPKTVKSSVELSVAATDSIAVSGGLHEFS